MADEKWLSSLKAGDEVAIDSGRYGNIDYHIRVVSRITAKRVTVKHKSSTGVEYEQTFRRDTGREIPSDKWHYVAIEPVTDEIREHVVMQKLKNKATKLANNLLIPTDRIELELFIKAIEPFVKTK